MNKEDFVPLEVAKLLKEKGFNEYCGAYYHLNWDDMTEEECFEIASDHDFKNGNNEYRVGAPTLYEAQKWLREEHNIHIRIDCWGENDWCYILYEFTKGSVHKVVNYSYQCYYNSYEDALKDGILEALTLI